MQGDDEDRRRMAAVDDLAALARRFHQALAEVAARNGLTTQQVMLLRSLAEPVPMRAFAEELDCDPSNVTGLVDRAERLGLVARVPDPSDRRVRLLVITDVGRSVRDRVNRELADAVGGHDGPARSEEAAWR
jgi:DNA-binding MarR family transcriptional regulator